MGSITPLESKPKNKCRKWRLFVSAGTNKRTGKRIQKSRRFHGTYGEAKKALAEFETECQQVISDEIKLGDFLDRWYEKRVGRMRESTLVKDRQSMRTLKWLFGEDTRLSEFDAAMIDEAFRDLLANGGPSGHQVKSSYAGYLKATLNALLKYARKEGYILANPMEDTEYISAKAPEKDNIPTGTEVKALLDALDCRDGRQMCTYLCAALGLRRAEALGLQWKNVDLDEGLVYVRVSLQTDGTIGKLKTPESRRTLPLPDYLSDAIRVRMATAKADLRVAVANGLIDGDMEFGELTVCCDGKGQPTTASSASHWWEHHRSLYGIQCGLHGLRHALLTELGRQGVGPKTIQSIAGHANPLVALTIYQHTNMSDKEAAFDAIAEAISPSGGGEV